MIRSRNKEIEFTTDEKLHWVFKYLIKKLEPEVVNIFTKRHQVCYGGVKSPMPLSYYACKCETENFPESIPFPFSGVYVDVSKKSITILSDAFYYKFPPQLLVELFNRFKEQNEPRKEILPSS